MRTTILRDIEPNKNVTEFVEQAKSLQSIEDKEFPDSLQNLESKHPKLWELWQLPTRIGLIYGGATKIKQYVFEEAKLQDIRGASALLDRINLKDIPGLFESQDGTSALREWLQGVDAILATALIPELLIYYKGGSVLAFCPPAFVDELANAIEKTLYPRDTDCKFVCRW